jgi:hypothetical protein
MQQPQYASSPPTNTMAIVSVASGIVSWFALPVLAAIVAIITGHMARSEIRRSYGIQGGDALAIIGLILGYLNLVVSCIVPLLILTGLISVGGICSICAALSESGNFDVSGIVIPPTPLN